MAYRLGGDVGGTFTDLFLVDAMQHGLSPIVPRECVGDRSPRAHEQALADIEGRYGDVRSTQEVIAALETVHE